MLRRLTHWFVRYKFQILVFSGPESEKPNCINPIPVLLGSVLHTIYFEASITDFGADCILAKSRDTEPPYLGYWKSRISLENTDVPPYLLACPVFQYLLHVLPCQLLSFLHLFAQKLPFYNHINGNQHAVKQRSENTINRLKKSLSLVLTSDTHDFRK